MSLVTNTTDVVLWHDVIKHAEGRCSIELEDDLEAYLVSLLIRYTNKPDVARQVLATAFLEALHAGDKQRSASLQRIGDQCLLFAGLFPRSAEKRHVKVLYFVDLGRSAYAGISRTTNDLFGSLAFQFVALMDVLQSIRQYPDMLPLEAYEQWNDLGSQRAQRILQEYTKAGVVPIRKAPR